MKPIWADTSIATERKLFEMSRAMPEWKHSDVVRDMVQTATDAQWAEICRRFPNASEHERRMRLASLWIDPELLRAAYGWPQES